MLNRFLRIAVIYIILQVAFGAKNWYQRWDKDYSEYIPRIYVTLPKHTRLSETPFGEPIYITQGHGVWEQYEAEHDSWSNRDLVRQGSEVASSYRLCPIITMSPVDTAFLEAYTGVNRWNPNFLPCFWATNPENVTWYRPEQILPILRNVGLLFVSLLLGILSSKIWPPASGERSTQPKPA